METWSAFSFLGAFSKEHSWHLTSGTNILEVLQNESLVCLAGGIIAWHKTDIFNAKRMDKPSTIDLALYVISCLVAIGGVVVPLGWDKHRTAAVWGIFVLLVLMELGAVLYWQKLELQSANRNFAEKPNLTADSSRIWKLFPIRDETGTIGWNYGWTDMTWIGPEGWLCGSINEGGGGGDVGRGVLLHTKNQGSWWVETKKEAFESGRGHFNWGSRPYSWLEIGPIKTCRFFMRELGGGKRRVEGWLAAKTGVYSTRDGGKTWRRSTPRPDEAGYHPPFAHFEGLADVEQFSDVYAVGWQGMRIGLATIISGQFKCRRAITPSEAFPFLAVQKTAACGRLEWLGVMNRGTGAIVVTVLYIIFDYPTTSGRRLTCRKVSFSPANRSLIFWRSNTSLCLR
jgi:hypothetical protein